MTAGDRDDATRKRLLVVDDDPNLREMYAEVLSADGFEVVTAQDGLEAFELFLTQGPFHALIVDQNMPRLTGKQLLKRLRGLGEDAPALLISGRLEVAPREQETLGLGAWLDKPFSQGALLAAVRALLSPKT
jgi:DNA-binding response OmpR family regulator